MEVIRLEKRKQKGAGGKRDRNLKTVVWRGNTTDEKIPPTTWSIGCGGVQEYAMFILFPPLFVLH